MVSPTNGLGCGYRIVLVSVPQSVVAGTVVAEVGTQEAGGE